MSSYRTTPPYRYPEADLLGQRRPSCKPHALIDVTPDGTLDMQLRVVKIVAGVMTMRPRFIWEDKEARAHLYASKAEPRPPRTRLSARPRSRTATRWAGTPAKAPLRATEGDRGEAEGRLRDASGGHPARHRPFQDAEYAVQAA